MIDPFFANDLYQFKALNLIGQEKYDEAIALHREAVALFPDQFQYHHRLGVALTHAQKYEEAEVEFRESIRLSPERAGGYESVGVCLRRKGQYAEAIVQFKLAIQKDPLTFGAYSGIARIYMLLDRPDDAIEAMEAAVGIVPSSIEMRLELNVWKYRRDPTPDNLHLLRDMSVRYPKHPQVQFEVGKALFSGGYASEARDAWLKVVELFEKHNGGGVLSRPGGPFDPATLEEVRQHLSDQSAYGKFT